MRTDNVQHQREINAQAKPLGGVTRKGFRPGQSGNPGGRPKGKSLTAILRRTATGDELKKVCQAILKQAARGDIAAAKLLFDRLDGPIRVELTGGAGAPLLTAPKKPDFDYAALEREYAIKFGGLSLVDSNPDPEKTKASG